MKIYPETKVMLSNGERFFGPGIAQLLEEIDKVGNIKDASENLGISYSKSRKALKLLEQSLNYEVVFIKHGGKNGAETFLTERGKTFLKKYEEYSELVKKESKKLFNEILGELL